MKATKLEPLVWTVVLAVLSALIALEAVASARLQEQVPLTPRELYTAIGSSPTKLQIIDIRTDLEEYEDTHVPGAIPFPGCDPQKADAAAAERVLASVPTIIVSADGDPATFHACARRFTQARSVEGGLEAWVDANLPEDSGEYVPPKAAAGGGCL